jgi:hypothetical protein
MDDASVVTQLVDEPEPELRSGFTLVTYSEEVGPIYKYVVKKATELTNHG